MIDQIITYRSKSNIFMPIIGLEMTVKMNDLFINRIEIMRLFFTMTHVLFYIAKLFIIQNANNFLKNYVHVSVWAIKMMGLK